MKGTHYDSVKINYLERVNMLDKNSEIYNLTVEQIAINVLIMLRGKFITVTDVLDLLGENLTWDEALEISSKCNELLLEIQRILFRKL